MYYVCKYVESFVGLDLQTRASGSKKESNNIDFW